MGRILKQIFEGWIARIRDTDELTIRVLDFWNNSSENINLMQLESSAKCTWEPSVAYLILFFSATKELARVNALPKLDEMTMEMYYDMYPKDALDPVKRPTFWPHTADEQEGYVEPTQVAKKGAHWKDYFYRPWTLYS